MTVKSVNKTFVSMDVVQFDRRLVGERKDIFPKVRTEEVEVEADQENGGSSTEEAEQEFPKSVAKFGRKKFGKFLHSQILRVKEEELLLREDIDYGEGCLSNKKERKKNDSYQESHINVVVVARPILPFSPLSGKMTTTTILQATSHRKSYFNLSRSRL